MYTLPKLPYDYAALEPYFDEATMKLHHGKHHQTYIDKLNAALEKYPDLAAKPVEELLADLNQVPEDIRTAVRNHGGGHWNHSFFWEILQPAAEQKPGEKLMSEFNKNFGNLDDFKKQFTAAALSHFGSGWAWLTLDRAGKMKISSTANQDTPLSVGESPILGLDVWEHAYYLKYQNKRADYVAAFWNLVNWEKVCYHWESRQ